MQLLVYPRGSEAVLASLVPGEVATGFREGGAYWIAKPLTPAVLYVDDAALPDAADPSFWEWTPGFYAGEVAAELETLGAREATVYFLDVSPHEGKLGRDLYVQMIREVADFDLSLILGTEPASTGLDGRSSADVLWVAYARFKQGLASYLTALSRLAERPIRRLRSSRQSRPLHQVRMVDVPALRQLATNAPLLAALAGKPDASAAAWLDDSVSVPLAEMTLDNPANRTMAAQIEEVMHRLDWVIRGFEEHAETDSDTRTAIRPRLQRRIRWLRSQRRELLRVRRSAPFGDVTQVTVSAAGLNAVSAEPAYSRAHRLGSVLLRRGVSDLGGEMHHLSPTWQVYEAWCFAALAKAFTSLEAVSWSVARRSGCQMALTAKSQDREVRMYFQLSCPSLGPSSLGYESISQRRIPDIVVEVTQGEGVTFYCLDAKYRVSTQALMEAMGSAHIYHDAIRRQGERGQAAYLLAPSVGGAPALAEPTYRDRHGVGVLPLKDDDDAVALWQLLLMA
ncbi:MAG: hypothetical protein K0Q68_1132 [Moraxellaceae bacterium]|jgi:hypothetical protein|nr:hypothetical protein [Moraxellaceae bacterium]